MYGKEEVSPRDAVLPIDAILATMFEQFVLGTIQGIAEWLPVSSEGLIVLARTNLFPADLSLADTIREALFLHLGTLLAGLVYFRHEVGKLFLAVIRPRSAEPETKALFLFLFIATLISGFIGFVIAEGENHTIGPLIAEYTTIINASIGAMLLFTGGLLLLSKRQKGTRRTASGLSIVDAVVLGVVQAFTIVPGLSRSGLTVSALLLRGIKEVDALRVSFLMSLPIVFAANIVFNLPLLMQMDTEHFIGLLASFIFGLLTIHALLAFAHQVNFGKFVIAFGLLLLLAALL